MDIIFVLLPISVFIAVCAVIAYVWSVRSGQYSDLDTPSIRMLHDDEPLDLKHDQKTQE
ncbi:MAG: cbb3-type cytochrome oxidase assembly protein CcoS [Deltaproteobacteria bacterium]|nr:cbb3-type cytochrome oxidase assembly protein CcoS [Deltaproteobacteria bacterium]